MAMLPEGNLICPSNVSQQADLSQVSLLAMGTGEHSGAWIHLLMIYDFHDAAGKVDLRQVNLL
jgi:hypothetical protein